MSPSDSRTNPRTHSLAARGGPTRTASPSGGESQAEGRRAQFGGACRPLRAQNNRRPRMSTFCAYSAFNKLSGVEGGPNFADVRLNSVTATYEKLQPKLA